MFTEEQIEVMIEKAVEIGFKKFTEKKYLEAEVILAQVLKVNPDNGKAIQLLGLILHNLGRFEDGIQYFTKALEFEPDNAENHNNISLCYANLGQYDKSIPHMKQAVKLAPTCHYMHGNLGLQYRQTKDIQQAMDCFTKALSQKNDDAHTWCMLGGCYGEQHNLDEAEMCFQKSIAADRDFAGAHVDLSSIHFLRGDWAKGWPEYEWRFECYEQTKFWLKLYDISKRWYGEPLQPGKRILLHMEQGIGDSIHFIRYVPLVKQMGVHIIIHCHGALQKLFAPIADEIYTVDPGTIPLFEHRDKNFPMPQYDYFASLVSLPYLLGNPPIPKTPYLSVDRKINLDHYSQYFKIGIVWAGNPQHPNDAIRSCRLNRFQTIHDLPGIKLFSLQQDKRLRQYRFMPMPVDLTEGTEGMQVVDMSNQMNDFEDTAAILKSLDLLITVDTAILHLAGAMKVPTWVLIPYNTDWRWKLTGEKTEWYSSVKLFRQKQFGNWDDVFDNITIALKNRSKL